MSICTGFESRNNTSTSLVKQDISRIVRVSYMRNENPYTKDVILYKPQHGMSLLSQFKKQFDHDVRVYNVFPDHTSKEILCDNDFWNERKLFIQVIDPPSRCNVM